MRRVKVLVTGRVQGVAYRASTATAASAHGVTGWVRNLPDGDVELEAQGDDAQIDALLTWCKKGPPAARVAKIISEPIAVIPGETSFQVRR